MKVDQLQTGNSAAGGLSDLTDMLGRWSMLKDTPTRMGNSVFTLPAGVEVTVRQVDKEHGNVLVNIGTSTDWMPLSWLRNCQRPNAGNERIVPTE